MDQPSCIDSSQHEVMNHTAIESPVLHQGPNLLGLPSNLPTMAGSKTDPPYLLASVPPDKTCRTHNMSYLSAGGALMRHIKAVTDRQAKHQIDL